MTNTITFVHIYYFYYFNKYWKYYVLQWHEKLFNNYFYLRDSLRYSEKLIIIYNICDEEKSKGPLDNILSLYAALYLKSLYLSNYSYNIDSYINISNWSIFLITYIKISSRIIFLISSNIFYTLCRIIIRLIFKNLMNETNVILIRVTTLILHRFLSLYAHLRYNIR